MNRVWTKEEPENLKEQHQNGKSNVIKIHFLTFKNSLANSLYQIGGILKLFHQNVHNRKPLSGSSQPQLIFQNMLLLHKHFLCTFFKCDLEKQPYFSLRITVELRRLSKNTHMLQKTLHPKRPENKSGWIYLIYKRLHFSGFLR